MTLTHWRAYYGMQPSFEAPALAYEPSMWESCAEPTAAQAQTYAETIKVLSEDLTMEYLYPALDDIANWMSEVYSLKNWDEEDFEEEWGDDWEDDWEEWDEDKDELDDEK